MTGKPDSGLLRKRHYCGPFPGIKCFTAKRGKPLFTSSSKLNGLNEGQETMEKSMRWARLLVWIALMPPLVIIIALTADRCLRAGRQDRAAMSWMAALDLPSPAFWPAGTFQRHPQLLPPAVDVRMSPLFDWDRDGRLLSPSPR